MSNPDDHRPEDDRAPGETGPVEASPPASVPDVTELQAALDAAREEATQLKDRWVRERADLENVKRRAARDRQEAIRYGAEHLVRDLLPIVDDLERAVAAARAAEGGEAVVAGVELVLRSFAEVLARHGVSRVAAAGERFDPTVHEAVSHVEHPEIEAGVVVEEHRGGYLLHDRLVRAAMVTVSKGNAAADLASPDGHD